MRKYTVEQVKQQSTYSNPLVIYNGDVFDVSGFNHPGGMDIIHQYHGEDITEIFHDASIHRHSSAALKMMKEMKRVGTIAIESSSDSNSRTSPLVSYREYNSERKLEFDLNQPLFNQLWRMQVNVNDYVRLVHSPKHTNNSVRLFYNPLLEMLSKTFWWMVPLVWLPVSYSLYHSASIALDINQPLLMCLWLMCVFLWTLVEYSLHRFVFHLDESLPNHKLAIMLHFALHGIHHLIPMDRMRLVFPPAAASIIVALIWTMLSVVLPHSVVCLVVSGGLVGYVMYDLMHYFLHHGVNSSILLTDNSFIRMMRSQHLYHHYTNHHEGYGITLPVWDKVFSTEIRNATTTKPTAATITTAVSEFRPRTTTTTVSATQSTSSTSTSSSSSY